MQPLSPKQQLQPGDILSYSSGSHDRGPYGFRRLRKGGNLLALIGQMFPDAVKGFGDRLPMVINAYPATVGTFDFGVTVDTYLSLSTGSRALHYAHLERMPVLLIGQPCYVADLIIRHLKRNPVMPDTLLLGVGGYVMPRSLENMLRAILHGRVVNLDIVHGYGVAEVDAGCLFARERDQHGELVYRRRNDLVEVEIEGTDLLLSLRSPDGSYVMHRFPTGDSGRAVPGGYHVFNPNRMHPNVQKILESWSVEDWIRRTGYLYYGREVRFQLRKGEEPTGPIECEYHDYEKKYGHYWLFKPDWSRQKDAGQDRVLRRTIM